MTAPIYIEQLLNAYLTKSAFDYNSSPNNGFTLVPDGYLSWFDGNGYIKTVSPLTINTMTGEDANGTLTPSYPYFVRGSVMDAVSKLSKVTDLRLPMFILDTLDRSEKPSELRNYREYDLRAFLVMAKYELESDEWSTVFDPYLSPLADNMISVLKKSIFKDYNTVFHERWGDGSKYGSEVENVFGEITNCIEITGTFIYNNKTKCNASI